MRRAPPIYGGFCRSHCCRHCGYRTVAVLVTRNRRLLGRTGQRRAPNILREYQTICMMCETCGVNFFFCLGGCGLHRTGCVFVGYAELATNRTDRRVIGRGPNAAKQAAKIKLHIITSLWVRGKIFWPPVHCPLAVRYFGAGCRWGAGWVDLPPRKA